MNARERSNAHGRAQRRKETAVWAMTGLVFLLILAAWLTWAWAVGPVG